ncbi:YfiR family protein [Archangium violaceum]|uniref:YfiR family protein n=1 Tax=Archangium violaceum TaxID=83451 RepID=UPI00193BB22D|nr:YfiR family protein [Archangium violaceum]QRK04616.1 YfiR family protein [Archangium violaceum]
MQRQQGLCHTETGKESRRRTSGTWLKTLGLMLVLLASEASRAEGLPPTLRASLLVRILAYDRRMGTRPPPLTVAVLHREGNPGSEQFGQEFTRALEVASRGRSVSGQTVRVIRVGFREPSQLREELSRARVVALYVCEGLEAHTGSIAGVTRQLSILSFAGSRAELDQGLAIGLSRQGDSPTILIRLSAARAEGADLDAGLLSLSQIVDPARSTP